MVLSLYILAPVAALGILIALRLKSRAYRFRIRTALVASLASLLGLWLGLDGSSRLEAGFESRTWPIVPGTVIESRVEGTRAFHPVVVYEYLVEGIVFRDSTALQQPSFGGRRRRKEVAEAEKSLYTPGQDVAVLYDPANPGRSFLGRSLHWSDYGRTGTGAVLFGAGICLLLLYLFGRGRAFPDTE